MRSAAEAWLASTTQHVLVVAAFSLNSLHVASPMKWFAANL